MGNRVTQLRADGKRWLLDGEPFDVVLLATSAPEAGRLLRDAATHAPEPTAQALRTWTEAAEALRYTAITTVYAWRPAARLSLPLLALRHDEDAPAQFVFDRGQLGGPAGLLAFVISASLGERDTLQALVLQQAHVQLGLQLQPVQTVVEKRATFACTPALQRPGQFIAPGLLACGDYVAGPYPATLEGAVRSGKHAARSLGQ
jgi:predicted NAD/FAD-dependent oxidoreductase